ncbi:MAG: hypothetical protein SA339_02275 [Methanomassiliicoccus sp.]|nr:hypothetical protein [Methanomassiliicoccus sp.]
MSSKGSRSPKKILLTSVAIDALGCVILVIGALASIPLAFGAGIAIIILGMAITIVQLVAFSRHPATSGESTATPGNNEPGVLYSDSLVRLSDRGISFLTSSPSRTVPYSEIEGIASLEPTLRNGKWRIWGTGNLSTWFVWDGRRPSRDRIFVATLRGEGTKLGFTVEDSFRVESILRGKGLIRP